MESWLLLSLVGLSAAFEVTAVERVAMRRGELLVGQGQATTLESGARIWDSGRELSSQLLLRADELKGKRVLELGAGTGIGGLSAAACGADVMLSDQADLLPLLNENIRANELGSRAMATQLWWGDASDMERVGASGPFDLVVGSDLLYAPHVFPLLLETLAALCTPERTEVLLTYPTRYTEDIFFDDAQAYFEVGSAEEVGCNIWATRMKRLED